MEKFHKLLARQIRKYLGANPPDGENISAFLDAVNDSYAHYEKDRELLDRSSGIAFQELAEAASRLKKEAEMRRAAIQNLKQALETLRSSSEDLEQLEFDESHLVDLAEVIRGQIGKRRQAEEKMAEQNAILIKINAELDRFVYSASHEMRAPLNSIMGLIGLTRNEKDKEVANGYLALMERSISKLDRFTQAIIEYSKNSRMDLRIREINFKELVDEILDEIYIYQDIKAIKLETKFDLNGPFYSDADRIKLALSNLVRNAVQYADLRREKPFVNIQVAKNSWCTEICVEDNGRGIPTEHLPNIFKMFFRVANDRPGSGMGLYIVKETVDILEGEVAVESQPGIGSRFLVKIPDLGKYMPGAQPATVS